MKNLLVFITLSFMTFNLSSAQEVRKISKSDLSEILNNPTHKLHVINFWASWCGPCVSELPEFQQVVNNSDSSKVDFLFISLDFPSEADKKLLPFLKKSGYNFNVALITDIDYNSWIEMVDPNWQGNIPSTLFYNNPEKLHYFISEPINKERLTSTIDSLLTK
ncbi:MAG: TlpA family protein disulfide reductase [Bacteroidales bacterium]|nr:TlpA family protein disulfide reductase [Bacteroidales bacterium]